MNFEIPSQNPTPEIKRQDIVEALMKDGGPDHCKTYYHWREQMESKAASGDPSQYVRMEIDSAEMLRDAEYYEDAREACEEASRQAYNMRCKDMLPEIETVKISLYM